VGQDLDAVKRIVEHALEELGQRNVNVIATGQRSSECSVSFLVHSKDISTALSTTHDALQTSSLELCPGWQQGVAAQTNRMGEAARVATENNRKNRAKDQETQFNTWNDSLVTASEEKARKNSILDEVSFRNMITLERKRTER